MKINNKTIGILKFAQWERCYNIFSKICSSGVELVMIDFPEDIRTLDALIIPRGPSLCFSDSFFPNKWKSVIEDFLASDKPLLAICGSLICFAKNLGSGCCGRKTFGLLDTEVINDKIDGIYNVVLSNSKKISGDFTDAPILRGLGKNVEIKAKCGKEIVGIRQSNFWGYSYYDDSGKSYEDFIKSIIEKTAK